ncbi:hypothetical protein WJX73_007803 [Symbiochloris irregularis]|uniref:Uncharacterized protein n=1 Tax=Symbiochloris irregularis TaxID=706552 RepID=A0AAW1PLI5_9CHLO
MADELQASKKAGVSSLGSHNTLSAEEHNSGEFVRKILEESRRKVEREWRPWLRPFRSEYPLREIMNALHTIEQLAAEGQWEEAADRLQLLPNNSLVILQSCLHVSDITPSRVAPLWPRVRLNE